jgi:hypothetical protein
MPKDLMVEEIGNDHILRAELGAGESFVACFGSGPRAAADARCDLVVSKGHASPRMACRHRVPSRPWPGARLNCWRDLRNCVAAPTWVLTGLLA